MTFELRQTLRCAVCLVCHAKNQFGHTQSQAKTISVLCITKRAHTWTRKVSRAVERARAPEQHFRLILASLEPAANRQVANFYNLNQWAFEFLYSKKERKN